MKKNILIVLTTILLIIFFMIVFLRENNIEEQDNNIAKQNNNIEKQEIKGVEDKITIINEKRYMDYIITIKTNKGDMEFKTYTREAPNTVGNFVKLANQGFYDGVIFHRVIDGFMIQGGDPTGTGRGGPGYSFNDEINPSSELYKTGYRKGIVAMANAGPNTQGSQFFIMVADYPLPPSYTIFGKIISGQDVADAISLVKRDANDRPVEDVIIETVLVSENI